MNINKRDLYWTTGVALLILSLAVVGLTLVGCGAQETPRDTWIDTHPTSVNSDGQCVEFDGEPCDDDPYDLDDLFESDGKPKLPSLKPGSARPSPKPMLTAKQPAPPAPKRTRR